MRTAILRFHRLTLCCLDPVVFVGGASSFSTAACAPSIASRLIPNFGVSCDELWLTPLRGRPIRATERPSKLIGSGRRTLAQVGRTLARSLSLQFGETI
jgi:hypothetical protein